MHLLGMRALHCWAAATPFLHVQGMPSITRVSQLTPMTPTGHVQVYVPASLLHMPPFWHGALMQALCSSSAAEAAISTANVRRDRSMSHSVDVILILTRSARKRIRLLWAHACMGRRTS
jgi:hypothetical protein